MLPENPSLISFSCLSFIFQNTCSKWDTLSPNSISIAFVLHKYLTYTFFPPLYIIEVEDIEKRTSCQHTCTYIHPRYSTLKFELLFLILLYVLILSTSAATLFQEVSSLINLLFFVYPFYQYLNTLKSVLCERINEKNVTIWTYVSFYFFLTFPSPRQNYFKNLSIITFSISSTIENSLALNPHHFKEIALIRVTKDLLVKMDCS